MTLSTISLGTASKGWGVLFKGTPPASGGSPPPPAPVAVISFTGSGSSSLVLVGSDSTGTITSRGWGVLTQPDGGTLANTTGTANYTPDFVGSAQPSGVSKFRLTVTNAGGSDTEDCWSAFDTVIDEAIGAAFEPPGQLTIDSYDDQGGGIFNIMCSGPTAPAGSLGTSLRSAAVPAAEWPYGGSDNGNMSGDPIPTGVVAGAGTTETGIVWPVAFYAGDIEVAGVSTAYTVP